MPNVSRDGARSPDTLISPAYPMVRRNVYTEQCLIFTKRNGMKLEAVLQHLSVSIRQHGFT